MWLNAVLIKEADYRKERIVLLSDFELCEKAFNSGFLLWQTESFMADRLFIIHQSCNTTHKSMW